MIKNFEEYINEDYFSKLASRKDTGNVRKEDEITEDFVRSFVLENHESHIKSISIRKENGKTIVDIDGDFYLGDNIEEIPFKFGKVTGTFNCAQCKELKSTNNFPDEVGWAFYLVDCVNLTSLEGCPKKVGDMFSCAGCINLVSLKGSPEECYRFSCSYCSKLKSLEGCPKYVDYFFECCKCGKQFTKEEVKSLCDVERIFV